MVDEGGRLKVFLSYSHKDQEYLAELDTHLALLKRLEAIETWSDQEILPGEDWEPATWAELEAAHVILLLVSADFIASDFCFREELKRAIERHEAGQARVIPLIIRACDWEGAPFQRMQALPLRAMPVTSWGNRDEAWTSIAKGIRGAIGFQQTKLARVPKGAGPMPPGTTVPSMSLSAGRPRTVGGLRTFSIEVGADRIPEDGYIGAQTLLHCADLLYGATEASNEIIWPDAEMATALSSVTSSGLIFHGALSGLLTLEPSFHVGPLLRITLTCPLGDITESHVHKVHLLTGNTNGSGFVTTDTIEYPASSLGKTDLPNIGLRHFAAAVDIVCIP